MSKPTSPFDHLLEKLPVNGNRLASDAATGWGMAGYCFLRKLWATLTTLGGFFGRLLRVNGIRFSPCLL